MSAILKEGTVTTPVDVIWPHLKDPIAGAKLVSTLKNIRMEGDVRYGELADGNGTVAERIVSVNDEAHRYSFTVTESPYGFEFHFTSIQLRNDGDKTRVLLSLDFKPDRLHDALAPQIDAAFADLLSNMENMA